MKAFTSPMFAPYIVALYIGFHLTYFIIMQSAYASTFGQQFIGARLISTEKKSLEFHKVIQRNVVGLFAGLLFFVPVLFNAHGFLTETKLTKD